MNVEGEINSLRRRVDKLEGGKLAEGWAARAEYFMRQRDELAIRLSGIKERMEAFSLLYPNMAHRLLYGKDKP